MAQDTGQPKLARIICSSSVTLLLPKRDVAKNSFSHKNTSTRRTSKVGLWETIMQKYQKHLPAERQTWMGMKLVQAKLLKTAKSK